VTVCIKATAAIAVVEIIRVKILKSFLFHFSLYFDEPKVSFSSKLRVGFYQENYRLADRINS
jgi:hypothetical protein